MALIFNNYTKAEIKIKKFGAPVSKRNKDHRIFPQHNLFYLSRRVISTRLFLAFPSSVLFEATGTLEPCPCVKTLFLSLTPRIIRKSATETALSELSF